MGGKKGNFCKNCPCHLYQRSNLFLSCNGCVLLPFKNRERASAIVSGTHSLVLAFAIVSDSSQKTACGEICIILWKYP